MTLDLQIQILDDRLLTMENYMVYATEGSNAFDVRACVQQEVIIHPGQTTLIPLGFAVAVPHGYAGVLLPRSGLGSKGLVLGNLVGLIDSDYRGEVKACVWNRTDEDRKVIQPMERIAQFAIVPMPQVKLTIVSELPATGRGDGGFCSTGTK